MTIWMVGMVKETSLLCGWNNARDFLDIFQGLGRRNGCTIWICKERRCERSEGNRGKEIEFDNNEAEEQGTNYCLVTESIDAWGVLVLRSEGKGSMSKDETRERR